MLTPRFLPMGDAALLVEFGDAVDPALNAAVMALDARVADAPPAGMLEAAPSFRSLMVQFDPLITDAAAMETALRALTENLEAAPGAARHWRVPACYEGAYAPDLADVAARTGLSEDAVAALHSDADHVVYMIGFLPGCPYMGGLAEEIDLPRRLDPRLRVPQGSVAIAVGLTVIYPVESPGGWNLIGRTPAPVFSLAAARPALLAPGDHVRFTPVSAAEHDRIAAAAAAGEWIAEREAAA